MYPKRINLIPDWTEMEGPYEAKDNKDNYSEEREMEDYYDRKGK
jgi:hypothetical protein